MSHNPWAGLASYQDPASGSTLLFCGRDNESYDLAALVDDNIFCTLYGKSGTGKTSLLNAGMFPRLRDMGYLPLSIRLGMEALGSTFQQCIAARLGKAATLQTADTVPLPADDQDEQWLWAWFARTRFVDTEGQVRFPVLVFDQFEEVFRSRRAEAETLLRQVHFMMDPSHSLGDDYDYNFRFLASIREDDLYLLEDSLDRHFMGDMKQCRYRLNALSDEGARDVILKPGEGLFAAGEQDAIVDTVIGIARSADGSINTNILSLVCSRIYDHYRRSGDSHISLDLVKRFVSSNPFEQFYNEVTENLGEKEKQFIEDRLVDAAGRRGSVSEPDFEKNVPNGAHLLEGTGRILQRVASGTEGRSYRIELIHDSFCAPLADQKLKRAARRRRRITIAVSILALIVAAVAAYIIVMSIRNARQTREILIQQEKFYAKQASQLLDEGDTYTALLLLNELTDPDGPFAKIPLQPEAECQMRRAVQMHDEAEWQVKLAVHVHDRITNPPQITPDGKYMLVTTEDGINVFENTTGNFVRKIGTNMWPYFTISHNSRKVAILDGVSTNYCAYVVDILGEEESKYVGVATDGITRFGGQSILFSNDDKYFISPIVDDLKNGKWGITKIKAVEIEHGDTKWDTSGCHRIYPMQGDWGLTEYDFENSQINNIESGNLAGRRIASCTDKGDILIHDVKTGRLICTIDIDAGDFDYYKYANDNEVLVKNRNGVRKYSIDERKWTWLLKRDYDMLWAGDLWSSEHQFVVSNKDTIFLHNINNGKLECTYIIDTNKYYQFVLYHDSTLILYNRADGTILTKKYSQKKPQKEIIGVNNETAKLFGEFGNADGMEFSPVTLFNDATLCFFHLETDNKIKIVDVGSGTTLFMDSLPHLYYSFSFSTDNRYMLAGIKKWENEDSIDEDSWDYVEWRLLDIQKKEWIHIFDTSEFSKNASWQTAVRPPFFAGNDAVLCQNPMGKLTKYHISTGEFSVCSNDTLHYDDNVLSTPDASKILFLRGGKLYELDADDYSVKKVSDNIYRSICFTKDWKRLIALTDDGWLCLYDVKILKEVQKRRVSLREIISISSNGELMLAENTKYELELWSLTTIGKLSDISHYYLGDNIRYPSFTSNGTDLVYYSDYITEDGPVGFVKFHVLSQEELKARVQELAKGRKLTEEEKSLLME